MTGTLLRQPKQMFQTASWAPGVSYKIHTYAAGTLTPKATYTDPDLDVSHLNTNPVTADSRGEVVMYGTGNYRIILKDAVGNTIYDRDNVACEADYSGSGGSALIGFLQAGTGAVARLAQAKMRESVSVEDFGAVGDGSTNDYVAIQAAIDAVAALGGGDVHFQANTYKILTGLIDRGATIQLVGQGATETLTGTIIKTAGAIAGWTITGNKSGARHLAIQGDGGAYNANSSGIIINGSKSRIEDVICIENRGHGFAYIYGNQSQFIDITAHSNSGHGIYIGDAIASIDDNASSFVHVDVRVNLLSGVYIDSNKSFANNFYNLVTQGNGEWGLYCDSTYNNVYGMYEEGSGLGPIKFDVNATYNRVKGILTATYPPFVDASSSQKNWVEGYRSFDEYMNCVYLDIGDKNGGLGGYFRISDNGTNYAFEITGSASNFTIPMTSTGGGIVTFKPDALYLTPPIAPTLLNSWVNFGGSRTVAGYYKDQFGRVYLQGTIKDGTAASPTALFTLPTGYRPGARVQFTVRSNGAFGSVFIDSDGNVYIDIGTNVEFSLDGINFRTT